MSIKIHHGAPGSFKTSGAVMDDFIPCVKQGRVVVTNVRGLTLERVQTAMYPLTLVERWFKKLDEPYKLVFPEIPETFDIIHLDTTVQAERDKLARFFHWAPKGVFFLIDEAQSIFTDRWTVKDLVALDFPGGRDAAALADRPATWDDAFDMHRHYGWDMTLTTPNIKKIRTDIREVSEGGYKHRNLGILGFGGRYNEGFHDAQDNGLPSQFISLTPKKISKEVWSLYDSTTTGTFTDTLAGIKLWKDPKILLLVGVAAVALWLGFRNPLPAALGGAKRPIAGAAPVGVAPPVSPQKAPGTLPGGIAGNVAAVSAVSAGGVNPGNESAWNAVGYYKAHGKNFVVLRRDGATRTVIDPKEAKYDDARIDFQLDGQRVANYTGKAVATPIGGKL